MEQGTFGFARWGGKRRGAGRKPKGATAGVSHATRAVVTKHKPALVTLRLCDGLRSLRFDAEHEIVKAARLETAHAGFRVVHYSLQSNHLHLIVEAENNLELAQGMKRFNVLLAKRWNKLWRRKGSVFADRYHLHVLQNPSETRNALVYALNNARKHGSWAARRPDVYSSGEEFTAWLEAGSTWAPARQPMSAKSSKRPTWSQLRKLHGSAEAAWTALNQPTAEERARSEAESKLRARSWMLRVGWKRRGLIGVMERSATSGTRSKRVRKSARVGPRSP